MFQQHSLLVGKVEHRRIYPVTHQLAYRVFSILVNLEQLEELDTCSRLFSVNRKNLLSLFTSDLADRKQEDLSAFARRLLHKRHPEIQVNEVWLQTYPRVFGYAFNPLSVYLCLDAQKNIVALIYEVSNTFGERIHYVQSMEDGQPGQAQKQMLVSPFNERKGQYGFSLLSCDDVITIGVSLRQEGIPTLKTWFKAKSRQFSDLQILSLVASIPFMTMKVIVAIHYQAGKLWLKGLRPPKENKTGSYSASTHMLPKKEPRHAAKS